jgi:hypothetical protein
MMMMWYTVAGTLHMALRERVSAGLIVAGQRYEDAAVLMILMPSLPR